MFLSLHLKSLETVVCFFLESFSHQKFPGKTGLDCQSVQDNHSRSKSNVLRGLHYQIQQVLGTLVCAMHGTIYDVVVDIRRSLATFGQWGSVLLSAQISTKDEQASPFSVAEVFD